LFGNTVGKAVDAITRGDEKEDYLKEYIPRVATNSIARGVKNSRSARKYTFGRKSIS